MFSEFFRKRILASKVALAFYWAVPFVVAMSFVFGFHLRTAIIDLALGALFGFMMATKFHKDNRYLVQTIQDGNYNAVLKYRNMFKQQAMPQSKAERAAYLEYLNSLEQNKLQLTNTRQLGAFVFLFVMLVLSILTSGVTIWTVLFVIVIIACCYSFVRAKNDLKKIRSLKERL